MSRAIYGVLGASFLWPWNAMLTASSLARSKLADDPGLFARYSSIIMIISTVASLGTTSYLAYHPQNYGQRVSYGEMFVAFSFLILGTLIDLQNGVLWLVSMSIITAISSVGTALVQNGVLAITQRIPGPGHALAVMNGQAVAGVLPPILPLVMGSRLPALAAPLTYLSVSVLSGFAYVLFKSRSNLKNIRLAEDTSETMDETAPSWGKLWRLLNMIWSPAVSILLAFTISLSYPVFANNVESQRIATQIFSPLTHLIWNSGDLCGRLSCSVPQLRARNDSYMMVYSVTRFLFIIAFIVISRSGNQSDVLYLTLMFAYGFTSGHLVSSAIARAPALVSEDFQPATGGLIGLLIATGLLAGSLLSFVVVAAL